MKPKRFLTLLLLALSFTYAVAQQVSTGKLDHYPAYHSNLVNERDVWASNRF